MAVHSLVPRAHQDCLDAFLTGTFDWRIILVHYPFYRIICRQCVVALIYWFDIDNLML